MNTYNQFLKSVNAMSFSTFNEVEAYTRKSLDQSSAAP